MIYSRDRFSINEITGEIEQPKIYACSRNLRKKGEIYPAREIRIKRLLNGADEISFTVTKNVKLYTDDEYATLKTIYGDDIKNGVTNSYDELVDYSVIYVEGFGYFEVSPTISDTSNLVKTLSGSALGETELSQCLCSLQVNTDEVISNSVKLGIDFVPTVLYKADDPEHSLLHRILTYAPNYTIGHVDSTLRLLQRTYSWDNADIISVFKDIADEINCVFIVDVALEDGVAKRKVSVFDAQYCKECGKRNIINGVCQDCGSTDIGGIGEDSRLFISTESLSDEITVTPDGNMKNCFIVQGGDDVLTNTVSGIQPSGNNKVYMFSEETMDQFSDELKTKYEQYLEDFADKEDEYTELLRGEYDIFDLILYLQSGRMPTLETDVRDIYQETDHVLKQLYEYFPSGLATVSDLQSVIGKNGTVRSVLSLLVDEGYAIKQDNANYIVQDGRHIWTGDIEIYEIQNNSNRVKITYSTSNPVVTLYNETPEGTQYSCFGDFQEVSMGSDIDYSATVVTQGGRTTCLNPNYRDYSMTSTQEYKVTPMYFNNDFETYVWQTVAVETKKFLNIEDQAFNNDKEWQKYSLNRLKRFFDGYTNCINTIDQMIMPSGDVYIPIGTSAEEILRQIRAKYSERLTRIDYWMVWLTDFIYWLYRIFGSTSQTVNPSVPSSLDINYNEYQPVRVKTRAEAMPIISRYIKTGTTEAGGTDVTDKAICCLNCNSTNVTLTSCLNCGSTDIETYGTEADYVGTLVTKYGSTSFDAARKAISSVLNMETYLGKENYKELLSYTREDVYQNSNYISSGLGNTELLINARELINQAKKALASACVSQHTVTGNVYAFVAIAKTTIMEVDAANNLDTGTVGTGGSINNAGNTLEPNSSPSLANASGALNLSGGLDRELGLYDDNTYIPFESYVETTLDIYDRFRLGNFIHYLCEDKRYKLRLSSMELTWDDEKVDLQVEYTDAISYINGFSSDIASMMAQVNTLSTSFNYVESQSLEGASAFEEFEKINNEGLMSAMNNVLSADNQSVLIDDRGITLRKWDYSENNWDPHQMRIIDRNIIMTDNNWGTSKLALGLSTYNNQPVYGLWADILRGDLILGNEVRIVGSDEEYPSDIIDKNGIRIFAKKPSQAGVELPEEENSSFTVYSYNPSTSTWDKVVDIDDDGNASFSGTITSDSGRIGLFDIIGYYLESHSPTSNSTFHIGGSASQPGNYYVGLRNESTGREMRMALDSFVAIEPTTEDDRTFNVTTVIEPKRIRLFDQYGDYELDITRKGFVLTKDIEGTDTVVARLNEDGSLEANGVNPNWKTTSSIPDAFNQVVISVHDTTSEHVWNLGTFTSDMIDGYGAITTLHGGHFCDANDNSGCTVSVNKSTREISIDNVYVNGVNVSQYCVLEVYYS